MTKRDAQDDYEFGTPGGDGSDQDAIAGGVLLVKSGNGGAYFIPRSVGKLTGHAADVVAELQRAALQRAELELVLQGLVAEARDAGASWAAIGWSIGTTGDAALKRFGR